MKTLLTILLFIASALGAFGQSGKPYTSRAADPVCFIANQGQVTDQSGNVRADVHYVLHSRYISIFVGNGAVHYQFYRPSAPNQLTAIGSKPGTEPTDTLTPVVYDMYRLDMQLVGANAAALCIPMQQQPYYENYHTAATGGKNVVSNSYNRVVYKDVYPFIDWVLYIKDSKLEYDFVVRPGGKVSDIQIQYGGASDIACRAGSVEITTPFGVVKENELCVYSGIDRKITRASFNFKNNTIGFSIPAYNTKDTLIIDPVLKWSTYFGDIERDCVNGAHCDKDGNVVVCGFTQSPVNIATTGSYQTVWAGANDGFIAKFSRLGSCIWSTYYGGNQNDYLSAIAVDNEGNIFVVGLTFSPSGVSTPGSYQSVFVGTQDGLLAKFDPSGTLIWGTYFVAAVSDVSCDKTNNIYICGGTQSTANIATSGSYQDTLAGIANAYLTKFNNDGDVIWGTYFGKAPTGSGGITCRCDRDNNVYLSGTVNENGIQATAGCYKDTSSGFHDCFIAKFDSTSALLWSTYYGGDSVEYPYGMACDDSANVYISGFTNSHIGIATAGAHQPAYGGGYQDGFLASFDRNGTFRWGTYYGGSSVDQCEKLICDRAGMVYVAGTSVSTSNIATSGSYQATNGGIKDAFLVAFDAAGSRQWGTYFGGEYNDVCLALAGDDAGNIYIGGYTASTAGIATEGAYQSVWTAELDGFLTRFSTNSTGITNNKHIANDLHLFPNPNNGDFTIDARHLGENRISRVEVFNMAGIQCYTEEVNFQKSPLCKITLSSATPGTYLLVILSGEHKTTTSFVVY